MQRVRGNERGMTLIELGMVLAVALVIMSAAAPRLSTILDNSRMQATSGELRQIHQMVGPLVEKLAFPTRIAGFPEGTVVGRTPLTPGGIASLPPQVRTEVDLIFPDSFDGVNPFPPGNRSYFLTLRKQNLGGVAPFAHDLYVATIDTCIPAGFEGIQQLHSAIQIDTASAACPGEIQVLYRSLVTFSQRARELRALRRYYCCGDRNYAATASSGVVFCQQWGQDNFDPTSLGYSITQAQDAYFNDSNTALFCR